MTNQTQAITKTEPKERAMEFIPFGNQDKIKLTVDIVKNLCCKPTKSGRRCSDTQALNFMMLCNARRLNPFEGDAFLVGYDTNGVAEFSLITAEQAFLKRAELNADYDGILSGVIVRNEDGTVEEIEGEFTLEGQTLLGGWAKLPVKNRKIPFYERLDVNKYRKPGPFWEKNPQHQIAKCARAAVLRRAFPTSLGGLYLQEETDVQPMKRADAYELPANRLVDVQAEPVRGENGNVQREQATPAEDTTLGGPSTPQNELKAFVESSGFKFGQFVAVMNELGTLKDADSFPSWDEIQAADAKRIMKAKTGLLAKLNEMFPATERTLV